VSLSAVCGRALAAAVTCVVLAAAPAVVRPALAQPITHAQPQLRLEPLDIVTQRGVFHFKVEMAVTQRSQEIGLMFRPALPADRGMLFEQYSRPQEAAYWMKNCPVPLDMLFIRADGTILSIARNTTPYSETPIYSGGPVTGVLELRGGRAAEIGAQPGDQVRHPFFRHG